MGWIITRFLSEITGSWVRSLVITAAFTSDEVHLSRLHEALLVCAFRVSPPAGVPLTSILLYDSGFLKRKGSIHIRISEYPGSPRISQTGCMRKPSEVKITTLESRAHRRRME